MLFIRLKRCCQQIIIVFQPVKMGAGARPNFMKIAPIIKAIFKKLGLAPATIVINMIYEFELCFLYV